jgi:hypothetical protein
MSAFASAVDALFADPNIGEDALWKADGVGAGVAVRVIRKSPDSGESFGDTRVVLPTVMMDVRKADVAEPGEGDLVEAGSSAFKVIGTPTIDLLHLIWTCEAVEL